MVGGITRKRTSVRTLSRGILQRTVGLKFNFVPQSDAPKRRNILGKLMVRDSKLEVPASALYAPCCERSAMFRLAIRLPACSRRPDLSLSARLRMSQWVGLG